MKRPTSLLPLIGLMAAERARWVEVIATTIAIRGLHGSIWPLGTAEEIADAVVGLPQAEAVDVIMDQLFTRDVGGPHSFAYGAGI